MNAHISDSYADWTHICVTNSNILTGVAGITADANSLINYARNAAQKYLLAYDDDIPVEQLAQRLCDLKQGYTQYGGKSLQFSPGSSTRV